MTAVMERQNTKTLAANEPQNGQLLQSDLSNTPILPNQERTWPLWHGSLIDHDVVTWENLGVVDFLWRTLSIPAMETKKITQLKWESNSLTFEELIFFRLKL